MWIRVDVGYITPELAYLSSSNEDISDFQSLHESFDSTFERFSQNELRVFVTSRLAETNPDERKALTGELRRMRESSGATR